ncbi:MAG TPA: hypothetical protein VJO99_11410 [Burkholderiaceae bacterium]|nr:hypothetical protein [Burkholderiaceae bacterium]
MAKQKIVWTALPYGRVAEGQFASCLRVSIVVSPRLTPLAASEQVLGAPAYAEFHNWPKTLQNIKLQLQLAGMPGLLPLQVISAASPALWDAMFRSDTPVAGFQFKDMSKVNLRSYAIRNVLGFLREHYANLALGAASTHPRLLPWSGADPSLKGMLTDAGTRTQKINLGDRQIEVPLPGFDRFFGQQDSIEKSLQGFVFNPASRYKAPAVGINGQAGNTSFPIRVLPSDWNDPAGNGPDKPLMSQFTSADEYTLYQANRFYKRSTPTAAQLATRRPDLKNPAPPVKIDDFDFHRIVASLADYPAILRGLGLIIDCALPPENEITRQLRKLPVVDGTIGVEVQWGDPHVVANDANPRTAFRATPQRFVPRERTADHASGLMQLQDTVDPTITPVPAGKPKSSFDIFQLDPDGAALKTTNFVLTAQNLVARSLKLGTHGDVAYTTGDHQPVAALRSGGLGVSRHGRAAQVAMDAAATALKNTAIESSAAASRNVVLFTEDVLRGYRVDVQHQGKWQSLCKREGKYELVKSGQTLDVKPDEGYVKGASTTGDGSDDHYLHEAVFRWTGWSMVTTRPGRKLSAVEDPNSGLQGEAVTDASAEGVADNGNGLAVRFQAQKGSLPRLRFGHDYRMRARVVDLAGNSLELDDPGVADLEQASAAVPYLRFEPVDPPALVHKHRVSEGESLERMVIRSNFNLDPAGYLNSEPFKTETAKPASADFEYVAKNERHVVPPKSSQLQCEQHGLFDAAFAGGTPAAIKAAYATAAREAGSLFDALPGTQIELVTPTNVKDEALTNAVPPELPSPASPTGGRLVGGQYIVHREDAVETPYLPDGAAGGMAVRGNTPADFARIGITQPMALGPGAFVIRAPQTEELVLIVLNGNDWPRTQGLRIVLDERTGTLDDSPCAETFPDDGHPKWDPAQRVLSCFVRKGHIARLRYSSFVDKRRIDELGIPRWSASAGQRAFIAEMALLGVHWMLTPYRALVMVHATQQPVCTPLLRGVSAPRDVGLTFTDLNARVQLHGPSTGKFEVVAEWDEWVDDPQQPRPARNHVRGTLSEIPLTENHGNEFTLADVANEVQLPPANAVNSSGDKRTRGNRHEFGDTKFRLVRYRIEATTRFREYLPASLYAQHDQITRLGPVAFESNALLGADDDPGTPVLFNVAGAAPNGTPVLSTHAPEVPRVVYTVPTFRWTQDLGPSKPLQRSTRLGNGLRVYLERPWFTSGDGELLGVVLLGDGSAFNTIPEDMLPFVTQWGLDPLFDTALPKPLSRASDFSARVASETLPLLEKNAQVHVVGHRVQWDDARKLWYCDIELDAGLRTYMPFVRLALARYQPNAIAGMKLSRVTLAEFAQVLPRRVAELQSQKDSPVVAVQLRGPVPDHGPMKFNNDGDFLDVSFIPPPGAVLESGRNKIELVLQTRDASVDSDLAWSDASTLASALALPHGAVTEHAGGGLFGATPAREAAPPSLFDEPALRAPAQVSRSGSLGELQQFEDRIALAGDTRATSGVATVPTGPIQIIDPVIWQASATLPAFSGKGRLVLREFERYYTDRTIPERHGSRVFRRRVVEERLVYSEFFPLD